MKSILLEPANEEELKMVEDFIKKNKIKGFVVEESKTNSNDFFNDLVRILIPII